VAERSATNPSKVGVKRGKREEAKERGNEREGGERWKRKR
jgi:hypothetical protein